MALSIPALSFRYGPSTVVSSQQKAVRPSRGERGLGNVIGDRCGRGIPRKRVAHSVSSIAGEVNLWLRHGGRLGGVRARR